MNFTLRPFLLDGFRDQLSLVHATSSRYYETPDGRKACLDFRRDGSGDISLEHQRTFLKSLKIDLDAAFLVKQVHGAGIYALDDPETAPADLSSVEADALITCVPGRPIAVLTADCLPAVLYDFRRHAVGTVHAGRKGTVQRILSRTVRAMGEAYGSSPEDILVGLGPVIGGCCYEVGEDCMEPFRDEYPDWAQFSAARENGKFMLDLSLANEKDAAGAGIPPGNIFRSGHCTSCEEDRFFSYRRDGVTGRMMTLAMLKPRMPH